jgi:hypothetical protein
LVCEVDGFQQVIPHTNRGLQEKPVGIYLPHIPIEHYKNNLLESYTSHTNRGLQEKPVGIHLPHIPIEHYKNNLLESIYLKYQEDYKNSMFLGVLYLYVRYRIPTGYSCNPLLVCEVDGFQQAFLGVLYLYVRHRIPTGYSCNPLLVCQEMDSNRLFLESSILM